MNDLDEMVKRGKALGYVSKTLDFAVGYMHETDRTLNLLSDRKTEPSKLVHEANWIFAHNDFLHTIIWFDSYSWFARVDRARSGKIMLNGQEHFFNELSW